MSNPKTLSTTKDAPSFSILEATKEGPRTPSSLALTIAAPGPGVLQLRWTRPNGGTSLQRVGLSPRPLPFGGLGWWFACGCGARVVRLYLATDSSTWGCRTCHALRYRSQLTHYPSREQVREAGS